jgi:antitoxin component YwqK of YwqJK toxin-antitoxin module
MTWSLTLVLVIAAAIEPPQSDFVGSADAPNSLVDVADSSEDDPFGVTIVQPVGSDNPAVAHLPADLGKVTIPKDAFEFTVPMKPSRHFSERKEYYAVDARVAGSGELGFGPENKIMPGFEHRLGERTFYHNGKLAEENIYRYEALSGILRQYYDNGQLFSERPYRNGSPDGTFRFYRRDGTLLGESTLKNGNGVLREYENILFGTCNGIISYKDGRRHGERVEWHFCDQSVAADESTPLCTWVTNYSDGLIDGWALQFGANYKLIRAAYWHRNRRHGVEHRLGADGAVVLGYPKHFVKGEEVSMETFRAAVLNDPILNRSIAAPVVSLKEVHMPPKNNAD